MALITLLLSYYLMPNQPEFRDGAWHVHPGQSIQGAIELAARDADRKLVHVHAGTYRPQRRSQALIWFNGRHDGVRVTAVGPVVLSAANEKLADRTAANWPAAVNHVVYFGDGITPKTELRGFTITGANNFVTNVEHEEPLEPNLEAFRKTEGVYGRIFFYTDGGAIKIFGRSYPTLEALQIVDNYASPCAGGISVEHRGQIKNTVQIRNCVFRNNRCLITGSAVDLLPGSAAHIQNCLFVNNLSNTGTTYVRIPGNIDWPQIPQLMKNAVWYQKQHGSGALTVFPGSRVHVDRCTFTNNFNGADDKGAASTFTNSIFWMNTANGGVREGGRYELDILNAAGVENCYIKGPINDLRKTIDPSKNHLNCPDPDFDEAFVPRNTGFSRVGYRPR